MLIKAGVFEKNLFMNVMNGMDKKDIQILLIQLLSDREGLYLMDTSLSQCLNSYSQKCLYLGTSKNFDSHRE
jgi:hypothetical protein